MLTEVNDVGESISENKQAELIELVANLSRTSDVVVISGSLPRGVESNYYTKLFNVVSSDKIKVADTEGARLFAALNAGVDLVKPNKEELQSTLKEEFKSQADLLRGCYSLIDKGAKRVLLSLGKRGAIITDGTKNYYCKSINVAINSTVGAGDGMLAAASMMLEQGAPLEEILRAGVAAGTATVTTFGKISFTKEKYDEIYENLIVEEIK